MVTYVTSRQPVLATFCSADPSQWDLDGPAVTCRGALDRKMRIILPEAQDGRESFFRSVTTRSWTTWRDTVKFQAHFGGCTGRAGADIQWVDTASILKVLTKVETKPPTNANKIQQAQAHTRTHTHIYIYIYIINIYISNPRCQVHFKDIQKNTWPPSFPLATPPPRGISIAFH